jgi:hypothetical protein
LSPMPSRFLLGSEFQDFFSIMASVAGSRKVQRTIEKLKWAQ